MARAFTPKVVTANDLLEGDVIYQTEDDRWSRELSDAELITDEAHAQVRLLDAARQANVQAAMDRAERQREYENSFEPKVYLTPKQAAALNALTPEP